MKKFPGSIDEKNIKEYKTNHSSFDSLFGSINEIRFNEMQYLFSKNNREEGLALAENQTRAYIYLNALVFLTDEERFFLLKKIESEFKEFKNSIRIITMDKVFFSIEPLLLKINKERLKNMTDYIIEELRQMGEKKKKI